MQEFTEWLEQPKNEELVAELSEGLAAIVQAVAAHDKPGVLTFKVSVEPVAKNSEMGTVFVSTKVDVKLPEASRQKTVWYATEEFGLQRSNPRQLRLVDEPAGDPVEETPPPVEE